MRKKSVLSRQPHCASTLAERGNPVPRIPHSACRLLLLVCAATVVCPVAAAPTRPLDREPFDQVILKESAGGDVLEAAPLDLPHRPLTTLPTDGLLVLELLARPGEKYEVPWNRVAEVRVYEQVLLAAAEQLVNDGKFDEAYEYYARLEARYPKFPAVNDAVNAYLRRNALALHQSQQDERALAVLVSLAERSPHDPALPGAVEVVAGEVIQAHLREQDFAAARGVLELWQRQFPEVAKSSAQAWQQRFEAAAERQVGEALRLAGEKRYVEARQAAQRALAVWPKYARAVETLARIQREFPFVNVGVFEAAPRRPTPRIDDWATLRASPLVSPMLVDLVGFGAEGGEYKSPLGELSLDESGRVLRLRLTTDRSPRAAGELARDVLAMADPQSGSFRPELGEWLAGVSIGAHNTLELQLKRTHVRPESLLQVPLPPATADSPHSAAQFQMAEFNPPSVIFAAPGSAAAAADSNPADGRMQAIVEQTLSDDDAAVAALAAGEIDVLDRVPPWHLARLRATAGVHVVSYRLPTVHVLLVNSKCPLAGRREFRRALCYGIDRSWIVDRVLLGGTPQAGFEAVSGPFPPGRSLSDPLRYGYDGQIAPRPFEPRLAAILARVAWASQRKADGVEGDAGDLPKLVLAHPSDPLARNACQLMQMQLKKEGLNIELREFTAEQLAAGQVDYDLRYAELAVWEPARDARGILGPGGLAGDEPSPQMRTALAQLDEATTWKDVPRGCPNCTTSRITTCR